MERKNNLDEITLDQPSTEDEEDLLEITEDRRTIFTEKSDPEITSLFDKWKSGRLILQADFQRQFVWDKAKCSKLIESALIDIPIPVIYLSEEKDNKIYVIDGQQRLTAFFSFIDGKFPEKSVLAGKEFKLSRLKVLKELYNKNFKNLTDEDQYKIKTCILRSITFKKDSRSDLKFEIFERLNTGSVGLVDQELRNCIYRGPYNKLLKDSSLNTDFKFLMNIDKPDKRMKDVELVLRFAAFQHASYLNYKPSMKQFLNSDMEKYQFITEKEVKNLVRAFKKAVQNIRSLLGENAFKRYYRGSEKDHNGHWESKRFNASLYDVLMWYFSRVEKNILHRHLDALREAFIDLMANNDDFIDATLLSTSSKNRVFARFDIFRKTFDKILNIDEQEPRLFSENLKKEFWKNDSTCAICKQQIRDIDDAALDHIQQYWLGGKTIPENARLVHRYCNWARSKKA